MGIYAPGQMVVYFEIDSVLPERPEFEFLRKSSFIDRPWCRGFRLKAIRLRKERSFGLLVPMEVLFGPLECAVMEEGDDVTERLGVIKYEPPVPAQLQGWTRGNFPSYIPKTDQERLENLYRKYSEQYADEDFEASLKLDGSSATFYLREGYLGACSRNLDLKMDEENKDNTFVKMALKLELKLREFATKLGELGYGPDIAVQGELMGPGIQGNRENFADHEYFMFGAYDITNQRRVKPRHYRECAEIVGIKTAPLLAIGNVFKFHSTFADFKKASEIASINHPVAEGLVYVSQNNPDISFKVINNQYLDREE